MIKLNDRCFYKPFNEHFYVCEEKKFKNSIYTNNYTLLITYFDKFNGS